MVSVLDMADSVTALEEALVLEAEGGARTMTKTHASWGDDHTLHAVGAVATAAGLAATKTWVHSGGGACPLLIIFDSESGALRAIIEAFALGQLRSGAISGVATRLLAAADADELAIAGTGKQALAQVAAVAAVRPLRHVRVFGRDAGRREAFVIAVRDRLGLAATGFADVAAAVDRAPIITLVTRAHEPFLKADHVASGAHVNAVGAIVPARIEFEPALLDRCDVITADSPAQARRLSRELIDRFADDEGSWQRVQPLSALLASGRERAATDDVTLFKALGIGLSDLALGMRLLRATAERGLGRAIPQPVRATPSFIPTAGISRGDAT